MTCGPTTNIINTLDEHDDGCCDNADCTFVEAVHANDADGATVTFASNLAGTLMQKLHVTISHAVSVIGNDKVAVLSGSWGWDAPVNTPTPGWTPVPVTISHLVFSCGGLSPLGGGGGGFIDFINSFACPTLDHDTFINNTSTSIGGAMDLDGSPCATISNSSFYGNTATAEGGALKLFSNGGTWSISNSIFASNSMSDFNVGEGGGALSTGGTSSGTITNSTFIANSALQAAGGAIHVGDSTTDLTITNSSFLNNYAQQQAGAVDIGTTGNVIVTGSTFARNTIDGAGQLRATAVEHEGFCNGSCVALIENNTFEGNTCSGCDSAFYAGALNLDDQATTYNVAYNTFANNDGGTNADGGALTGQQLNASPNIPINSNLFQRNLPFACNSQFWWATTSTGHNVNSDGTCNLWATGDEPNTDAQVLPLADNGGPTLTAAITNCSPAWNTADVGTEPGTDQRGVTRPQSIGPDRGAFELSVGTPLPTNTPLPTATIVPTVGPNQCCSCPDANALCAGAACPFPCVIVNSAACAVVTSVPTNTPSPTVTP